MPRGADLLRDIILYITSLFPRGVGRTRLMKLLFLVDAEAYKRIGHEVTGVKWRRWYYGPFSKKVLEALDSLVDEGLLVVDPGPEVRYKALEGSTNLPADVKEIINTVVKEYGFLPLEELLKRVYSEYHLSKMGIGERITFDLRRELMELAEKSRDEWALVELVGGLYELYREPLELLPSDTLLLYGIAASYLAEKDPKELRTITNALVDLLDELKTHLEKDKEAPLPPSLRSKIMRLYKELLKTSARAVGG